MALAAYSSIQWIMWSGYIPTATTSIAPGAYLAFPPYPHFIEYGGGSGFTRTSVQPAIVKPDGIFIIQAAYKYYNMGPVYIRIRWQVPVANSGQLGLQYSTTLGGPTTLIPQSVVGTSYGHCQLMGDYLLTIPNKAQYFVSLVNPAVNQSTINLMSHGDGNLDANFSIMFESVQ